jgi:hypothetical protein
VDRVFFAVSFLSLFLLFAWSRIGVGLLALPLCGAAVTFFAAAKKVTKESSSTRPRGLPKCRPHRPNRAWLAHGLSHRTTPLAGSAPNSFGKALRAADGSIRETNLSHLQCDGSVSDEARANPMNPAAAKQAGAI